MYRLTSDRFFVSKEQSVAVEPRLPQPAYPEHTHDFDEIVIVCRGQGTHILNGRPYVLYPGMVCYIQASDHHLYENVHELHLVNVLYRSKNHFHFLNDITPLLPDQPQDVNSHWCIAKRYSEQIQQLLNQLTDQQPHNLAYEESIFLQLLVTLNQACYSDQGGGSNEDKVNQLMRWLQCNFVQAIDWQQLAEQFNLPLRSLHRHIKNNTGYTPQRYLTKLRLSDAHYQLCYSDNNITDIAFSCGFNDSAHFSTAFKHEFDVTPSVLRGCRNKAMQ